MAERLMIKNGTPDWDALRARYTPMPDDVFYELSEDERREVMASSLIDYAYRNLKIRDKEGRIIPFVFNRIQLFVHHVCETMLQERGMVRLVLCKGRQMGQSTYVAARFWYQTTQKLGSRSLQLCAKDDGIPALWMMLERFHAHGHPELVAPTDRESGREIRFQGTDQHYRVGSAGATGVARGDNYNRLHWTEVALASPDHAEQVTAGALQTVPLAPATEIIWESTPNGWGGYFHELWTETVLEEDPSVGLWGIYAPAPWHEEYHIPVPEDRVWTREEQELMKRWHVDEGFMEYRRQRMSEMKVSAGGSRADLFDQEYSFKGWADAFLKSGRTFFDQGDMDNAQADADARKPQTHFDIAGGKLVFRPDGRGVIYEQPIPGIKYAIGADPAEGLARSDDSAFSVIDCENGTEVAVYAGKVPPDTFGSLLALVGKLYNKALVCPEANNHGHAVLLQLQHEKYANVYYREQIDTDSRGTRKKGWATTEASRWEILDCFEADLRAGVQFAPSTVNQMRVFVLNENGKPEAQAGCKDDRVIARAIASRMWRHVSGQKFVLSKLAKMREDRAVFVERVLKMQEVQKQKQYGKKVATKFFADRSSSPDWSKQFRPVPEVEARKQKIAADAVTAGVASALRKWT
jgi:hypothetical protein